VLAIVLVGGHGSLDRPTEAASRHAVTTCQEDNIADQILLVVALPRSIRLKASHLRTISLQLACQVVMAPTDPPSIEKLWLALL
jgi:hypothetical protein